MSGIERGVMTEEFTKLSALSWDILYALGIFGAFVLAIAVVRMLWMRVLGPMVRRTDTDLDDVVLLPLRGLLIAGLLVTGVYHAIQSVELVKSYTRLVAIMDKAYGVALVALILWTLIRLLNGLTAWYIKRMAQRPVEPRDVTHETNLVRRVASVLVLGLGALYVLKISGADITPLLASGAIGGLAVALAFQDTLANLFGGFFIGIDRPVRVGDFIKIESGEEGYVEEIGWRSTRIRLLANNMIVIPNSKLSQSVVMNYFMPRQDMSVYVPCGVAYDSDLQRVENVAIQVAKEVMQQVEGAVPDWEPVVRWKEFGDFAISFVTVLRVRQFEAQYALQSEFIKALHRRFKQEGIEIPFPIRTVIMKNAS